MRTSVSDLRGGVTPTRLLWTSGWDSTFRLLAALFVEGLTVEPHYIIDRTRSSLAAELRAMDAIRVAIAGSRPQVSDRLLPTVAVELAAIPPHELTSAQFARLAARGTLGGQYEWIARYAVTHELHDLELSIHHDDRARSYLEGHVEKLRETPFASYRLAPGAADSDLGMFANFTFPVYDLTKLDMRRVAEQHGFLDILDMSWFCHRPRGDRPCGLCNPCLDAVAEGVGYRLPASSRLRQAVHRVLPWTKVTSRVAGRFRRRVSVRG